MDVVHAFVQETPYNFSKYLIGDLKANIHNHQPYLIYPCFVMKVFTSHWALEVCQSGFQGPKSFYKKT
ncbi:hypothetical protein Hanom_Chr03g00194911 [Helianthus anomalus]